LRGARKDAIGALLADLGVSYQEVRCRVSEPHATDLQDGPLGERTAQTTVEPDLLRNPGNLVCYYVCRNLCDSSIAASAAQTNESR
jgi:hypothetical protein